MNEPQLTRILETVRNWSDLDPASIANVLRLAADEIDANPAILSHDGVTEVDV